MKNTVTQNMKSRKYNERSNDQKTLTEASIQTTKQQANPFANAGRLNRMVLFEHTQN